MPTALPEGSLAHRPRPLRRLLGRLLLASVLLVLGLLATVVAVQVYYRLTPPALSEDARAIARELAALPRESENGFRLAGLLAPETMDPVAYGRCLTGAEIEIAAAWRKEVPRGLDPESAEWKALYERREAANKARRAACANGQAAPSQSDASDGPTRLLKPGFDWAKLLATPPMLAPTVAKRAAQVLENAPAPLALPVEVLQFGYQPLLAAHTETLAAFARAWDAASARERTGLLGSIGQRNRQWAAFAKGGLTDAMIAHAALEYGVLVLEAALRRPGLVFDQALVEAVDAALIPLDDLPAALATAFLVEHRARAELVADARKTPCEALRFGSPWATPLALERWLSPVLLATVDPNDTENLSAQLTRALQRMTERPKDVYTDAALVPTADGQRLAVTLASSGRSFGRDKPLVLKPLP